MSPQDLLDSWRTATKSERPMIAAALLDNRAATLPALRAAALAGEPHTRALAISMLGQLRDDGALAALLAATSDADERIQARAVSALRAIGDSGAAPRLRQLIHTTTSRAVLKRSLAALGKFGSAADVARIRPFLAHPDESVRIIAAGALAMHGNVEGQDFLLEGLDSEDPLVQKNATFALGYLDTTDARARLAEILADPKGRWRSYALMAQTQQTRRTQTPAQAAGTLENVARGRDRLAAMWALDELTEMTAPEAAAALQRLIARRGRLGAAAEIRAKIQEGR